MRITTLIENGQDEKKMLKNEHGLSIFIETDNGNFLFDTGQSGDFVENAEKLNIDLKTIDTLILSHAHCDHCGGVKRLLQTYNIKPKLIVNKDFFKKSNKYHYTDGSIKIDFEMVAGYSYIGLSFDENYIKGRNVPINYVDTDVLKLSDEVFVYSNFNKYHDFEKENQNMKIKDGNEYIVDNFSDEIAIGLKTKKGFVILLGCAHPGFLNMVDTISERTSEKIVGIIGGTHLIEADDERIFKSLDYLKKSDVTLLGLSHCTGPKAIKIFDEEYKNSFINRTGTIVELE